MDMGIARMDYLKCIGTLGMNLNHQNDYFMGVYGLIQAPGRKLLNLHENGVKCC